MMSDLEDVMEPGSLLWALEGITARLTGKDKSKPDTDSSEAAWSIILDDLIQTCQLGLVLDSEHTGTFDAEKAAKYLYDTARSVDPITVWSAAYHAICELSKEQM